MTDPFAAPSTATGIKWADLKDSLLLIRVSSIENGIKTVHGDAQAARCDVTVLDGPQAGTAYIDTLVFPKVLVSQVKANVGGMVLGRLGQGSAKPGQSAPWLLAEATDADKNTAREYLAKNSPTPF